MSEHPFFDAIVGPHRELLAEALAPQPVSLAAQSPRWPTAEEVKDIWHQAS